MLKGITVFVLVALFIVGYVKYLESRGIYFPLKAIELTPKQAGLNYEDVYFKTEDNLKINAWFIPQQQAEYTILFCHGNAGNISHRMEKILMLHSLKLNVLIIDYRGYGQSQGRPSEQGIYLDTQAAYQYLISVRRLKPQQIILYGESLGTAAIIQLAARESVAGLIVEGGFSTGRDMAREIYPFLPAFLFANSFDCLSRVKKIGAPKLFIHSQDDRIVPISLARKLYEAAPKPKQFAQLTGGHNSAFLDAREKYLAALKVFVQNIKP